MKKVSFLGVLVGGFASIVATQFLWMAIEIFVYFRNLSHLPIPKDQSGFAWLTPTAGNYALPLLIGATASVLGGYIAAWTAKHNEQLNGLLSSWLSVLFSIWAIEVGIQFGRTAISWRGILLLIVSVAAALFGGYLRLMQNRPKQLRDSHA